MPEEIWKPIAGYEGLYEISNLGRVKSFPKKWNKWTTIILSPGNTNGYLQVMLCGGTAKNFYTHVHRLVALAFIPNPENKRTVNHKDGNKGNNHVNNLEWNTDKENSQHAYDTGLLSPVNRKLAYDQVSEIRALKGKKTHTELSIIYGVSRTAINFILNNKTYIIK